MPARVLLLAHCGILHHRGSCWRRQSGNGIRRFADCSRTKGAGNHVTLLRRRGGGFTVRFPDAARLQIAAKADTRKRFDHGDPGRWRYRKAFPGTPHFLHLLSEILPDDGGGRSTEDIPCNSAASDTAESTTFIASETCSQALC